MEEQIKYLMRLNLVIPNFTLRINHNVQRYELSSKPNLFIDDLPVIGIGDTFAEAVNDFSYKINRADRITAIEIVDVGRVKKTMFKIIEGEILEYK